MKHNTYRRPKRIKNRKSIIDRMASWVWLSIAEVGKVVSHEAGHVRSLFSKKRTAPLQDKSTKSLKNTKKYQGESMSPKSHVLDLRDTETVRSSLTQAKSEQEHLHIHLPERKKEIKNNNISQKRKQEKIQTGTISWASICVDYWKKANIVLLRQAYRTLQVISRYNKKIPIPKPATTIGVSLAGIFALLPISPIRKLCNNIYQYLHTIVSDISDKINKSSAVVNEITSNTPSAPHTKPNTTKAMIKKYLPKRKHSKTKGDTKTSFWLWRWIKNAFFGGVIVGFIGMGIFMIWVATLEIPSSNIDDVLGAQSTKIYDSTGEVLLYDVFKDEKRTVVRLDQISENMQKAILATEDDEFYSHGGYDVSAILRGVCYEISRVVKMSTFGGTCPRGGGSTITQQVIKNTLLNADRKLERKVKEVVLARKLEKQKTKEEILEIYLNEIAFGGPIYGVEQASLSLFAKNASDLTIAESAYLAALPKAPTTYLSNQARFDGRQQFILGRMKAQGFITDSEYEEAKIEDVQFRERVDKGIKAPHFVFHVLEEIDEKLSTDEENLNLGGYKIQTTLDWELQQELEAIVATQAERVSSQYGASNLAVVAIENKTGKIKAMVGSKDYFAEDIDGKFNIATALRQPGSTFKPFVYASAFTKGYTPETILWDTPTEFSTSCYPDGTPQLPQYRDRCYSPNNYDKGFRGPISIRGALAGSLNIPAVKVLYLTGIRDSMSLARDLGINSLTRSPNFYGLNLVLGGGEVQLLEMTNAYSAFANAGKRHEIASWESVVDENGEVVSEYEVNEEQVLSANVAAMINSILSDDNAKRPVFGASSRLYYGSTPVAVKTGTTNNFRDVWTIGYSSDITVGVWAGNNDNTPLARAPSSNVVGPFWREAMDAALKKYDAKPFAKYTISDAGSLPAMLRGEYELGSVVYIDPQTGETIPNPTEEEIEAGIYQKVGQNVYHSILHTVNKTNPRSGAPNPGGDSLYENFEYGVEKWTQEQGWTTPITEETIEELIDLIDQAQSDQENNDNGSDSSQNKGPLDFSITSPASGSVVDPDDRFDIELNLTGDATDAETIYYYINNSYVGSGTYRKTSMRANLSSIRDLDTSNIVKVIVQKTNGSRIEKTIPFTVQE